MPGSQKCPQGCQCRVHSRKTCDPDCQCGKHIRTKAHNELISLGVLMSNAKKSGGTGSYCQRCGNVHLIGGKCGRP